MSARSKLIYKCYSYIGGIYGAGSSYYYLNKVNDVTYDINNEFREHPLTLGMITLFTVCHTGQCLAAWPFFAIRDYSVHQKNKMGIIEKNPPYPFDHFKWKKEN